MAKDLKLHHRTKDALKEHDVLIATDGGAIFRISQEEIKEFGEPHSEEVAKEIKKKLGNFTAGLEHVESSGVGKSYFFNCPAFKKSQRSRRLRLIPLLRPPRAEYEPPKRPIVIVAQNENVYTLRETLFDDAEFQWEPSRMVDKVIKKTTGWMVLEGVSSAFFRPSKHLLSSPLNVCVCYLLNCESFKEPDEHE